MLNYAYTIGVLGYSVPDVLSQLENVCDPMLMWFTQNCMQANTEKFQLMLFCRNEVARSLNVGGTKIISEPVVKLLGVSTNRALSFSDHITI